ncbi:hypothetical protein AWC38_SpisGene20944 [Stylophora pistillata]|uniref:Uncharacterized protein n=1 Tax=Stylophora pistillata TaxID=50429 RepID=A0A2B4REV3_STYPI|nr:hypothetical protein AWC38_SpisGene20944 [Stylophora pistillata]
MKYCREVPLQKTECVKEIIHFRNLQNIEPAPFTICADFESFLKPITQERGKKTNRFQYHVPCSYGGVLISRDPEVRNLVRYHEEGDECGEWNSEKEEEDNECEEWNSEKEEEEENECDEWNREEDEETSLDLLHRVARISSMGGENAIRLVDTLKYAAFITSC